MSGLLPKWLMLRYLILWKAYGSGKFDFDSAFYSLGPGSIQDNKKLVGLVLSELRKAGWVSVDFNTNDHRKRIYTLKDFRILFEGAVAEAVSGAMN